MPTRAEFQLAAALRELHRAAAERDNALAEVKQLKEDAFAAAQRYLQLQGLLDAAQAELKAIKQDSKNLFVGKKELVLGLCGNYASADKTITIEPHLWSSQWYGCIHRQGVYLACIKDTPSSVAECLNEKLKQLIEELSC